MRAPLTIVSLAVTSFRNQFCVGATSSSHRARVMLPLISALIVLSALGSRSTATVLECCSVNILT